jgi:hypothetical protein
MNWNPSHWTVAKFAHFQATLKLGMKLGLEGQTRAKDKVGL